MESYPAVLSSRVCTIDGWMDRSDGSMDGWGDQVGSDHDSVHTHQIHSQALEPKRAAALMAS